VAAYAGRADPAQFEAGATLRSEVREAYNRVLTAYDIARHQRDTVLPLTEVALQEMQLNYNAMLEDVYELLDATREQIEAGREYVDSLAEFWVAQAELTQLLGGRLPEAAATMTTAEAAAAPTPSE
jgi:outer membrane protein TolC